MLSDTVIGKAASMAGHLLYMLDNFVSKYKASLKTNRYLSPFLPCPFRTGALKV